MKKVFGIIIFVIIVAITINLVRYELNSGIMDDFKTKIDDKFSKKVPKSDQYYIDMLKDEYKGTSNYDVISDSLCVVNTISQDQVKVTCKYTIGVNCISYNKRAYTGVCDEYQNYEDRTIDKIYDIEYEKAK